MSAQETTAPPVAPLPCPFCGNAIPDDVYRFHISGQYLSVQCSECGARGPSCKGYRRGDMAGAERDSINCWNDVTARTVSDTPPPLIGEAPHVG